MTKRLMKNNYVRVAVVLLIICAVVITLMPKTLAKDEKPSKLPEKATALTGVSVQKNAKASVDASNLTEGYVMVTYTGGKDCKIKVQIVKQNGTTYTYDLNKTGKTEVFPLTEGDGKYTISIFENISGTKYAQAYSCSVEMKLRNDFLPFLYSNQYVNYTAESKAVVKAAELMKGAKDQLDGVAKIYTFVTTSLKYDTELAKTVQPGYLPNIDAVLDKGKGICFDYASLMSAMLRSSNIPCKLVVGYAGEAYHAWINVYIDGQGWIDKLIYFDGENWKLMDPTFASSLGQNSDKLKNYIGDGKNYTEKYAY